MMVQTPQPEERSFLGDDYYFFAVSLTALKWAALGRQMGRVAGSRQWLAEEERNRKKEKERKKKEEDIGGDGEQRVGGSWNQKAGKEENQGEADRGEDIWCFFQVSSPWIIFFFGYHFIGCYRLFICWYSTCVAGFFLCFFDLTLKMVLLCFILCFFFL